MTVAVTSAGGVPTAIAAAACFGISSFLQFQATHEVPQRPAGRPGLLLDLLQLPIWRLSIVLAAVGFGLQVLALRLAPLILVQPLLVTGVLWYVVVSAHVRHGRPDRVIVVGTLVCLASLAAFLTIAQPSPGSGAGGLDTLSTALPLGIGLASVVAVCLLLARRVDPEWRPVPLSLAAGVCYGVTAGFVRSLAPSFADGFAGVFAHWEAYAILVLGPLGVLLSQNSYQAGRIGVLALVIITVVDPLVSIGAGLVWLDETIRTGVGPVLGEIISLAALVLGVGLVALRAPHITEPLLPGASGPSGRRRGRVEDGI